MKLDSLTASYALVTMQTLAFFKQESAVNLWIGERRGAHPWGGFYKPELFKGASFTGGSCALFASSGRVGLSIPHCPAERACEGK